MPRNHIGKKGIDITPELAKKYGIPYNTIQAAYRGDESANREIGKQANKAEVAVKLAPLVKQRVLQVIAGTNAVNEADTEILKAVKAGTLKIEGNQDAIELANNDLTFKRIEANAKHNNSLKSGKQKHDDTMEALKMSAEIDEVIRLADHEYRMEQLESKVPLLQLNADRQNAIDRNVHYLEQGAESNLDLVPQKEYGTASPVKKFFRWLSGL